MMIIMYLSLLSYIFPHNLYILSCSTAVHKIGACLALRMVVQSSHKDPEYLDQRVEEFLTGYEKHLMELSDEEFQKNITAVIDKLTEKSKNLDQETGRFWGEVWSAMISIHLTMISI